jgi:hypothetical protein
MYGRSRYSGLYMRNSCKTELEWRENEQDYKLQNMWEKYTFQQKKSEWPQISLFILNWLDLFVWLYFRPVTRNPKATEREKNKQQMSCGYQIDVFVRKLIRANKINRPIKLPSRLKIWLKINGEHYVNMVTKS